MSLLKCSTLTFVFVAITLATGNQSNGRHLRFPEKVMGLYIILADDYVDGFGSDADWQPALFPYQQEAANVLYFTFINPETMAVPPAFERLAATRGTGVEGAVPEDTLILFAIGGYAYSIEIDPWHWLTNREAAEAMAEEVAGWIPRYGIDGVDLDIEEGAGERPEAADNMQHFVRRLRELQPDIIIGQPTYGNPIVPAENAVINMSWDDNSISTDIAESVGVMVYEGAASLDYVPNYTEASAMGEDWPITCDVPSQAMLVGAKGNSTVSDILYMAEEVVRRDLLGIMVWYASVENGFQYCLDGDASTAEQAKAAYILARRIMNAPVPN